VPREEPRESEQSERRGDERNVTDRAGRPAARVSSEASDEMTTREKASRVRSLQRSSEDSSAMRVPPSIDVSAASRPGASLTKT
jgi:hypothetical protein